MNQPEIDHLHALIAAHKQRLHALELQAARYGWEAPPQVQNEIGAITALIEQIERQLASDTLPSYESGRSTLGTAGARIAALDRRYLLKRLRRAVLPGIGLTILVCGVIIVARTLIDSGNRPAVLQRPGATMQSNALIQAPTVSPTSEPTPSLTAMPTPTSMPLPTTQPRWPIEASGVLLTDGAQVAHTLTLIGRYPLELAEADDLWVIVKTPAGRYYPQSLDPCQGKATPKQQGRWEMRVGIGSPGDADAGKFFDLLLTAASPEIGHTLSATVQSWCRNRSYPGLVALPPGLVVERTITLVRTAVGFGPPPALPSAQLPGQVSITSPLSGTVTPQSPPITGTFTNIGAARIWILIHPINGRWYPQSANACGHVHTQLAEQSWSVPAVLGGAANSGEPFDIVVVLADADAHAFLDAMQAKWCAAGEAPGLLTIELPPGLTQQAHIRVIRE